MVDSLFNIHYYYIFFLLLVLREIKNKMFLWSLKAPGIQVLCSLCMVVMLALLPPTHLQDSQQNPSSKKPPWITFLSCQCPLYPQNTSTYPGPTGFLLCC